MSQEWQGSPTLDEPRLTLINPLHEPVFELVEKKLIGADEIRRQIKVLDSRTPALGAKVVARAWVNPDFRRRLLAHGRAACEQEFGITFYDDTDLIGAREHRKGTQPDRLHAVPVLPAAGAGTAAGLV